MCKQAGSRILFLLLVLGAPLAVCAQSQEPHARFSVEPGDPVSNAGLGLEPEPTEYFQGTKFTFTAYAPGAVRYEVKFEAGDSSPELADADSDGRATFSHIYYKPGQYTAVMTAWNEADELIEPDLNFTLQINVKQLPADPQAPPSHARFYVAPRDPTSSNVEVTWADFTFTADVSEAERYELDFDIDDQDDKKIQKPPGRDGKAIEHHRYKKPGLHTAKLKAWRNSDELVEIDLLVSVQAPTPAVALQWPPPVRPAATVPPAPAKPDTLPWLLLLAAIAILLSKDWGLTGTGLVTFEPTRDRGECEVIDAAVSMRVRHPETQFVISDDAVLL